MRVSPAETGLARHRALVRRGSSALPFVEVEGTAVHAEAHPAGLPGTVREDVAEVAVASGASHFRACHAVRAIFDRLYGAGECLRETRPSGTRFELGVAGEERIAAAGAAVRTVVLDIEVRPAERPLGAVLAKHRVLLRRESLPPLFVGLGDILNLGHGGLQSAMRTASRQELTIVSGRARCNRDRESYPPSQGKKECPGAARRQRPGHAPT